MLQTLFEIVIANAVTATLLAIGVALFARLCRCPAVTHWLWLMVFLKLITPPLITFPLTILPPPQEFHESPATVVSVEKSAHLKSQSPAITVVVAPANTSSLAPASPAEFQWRNYVVVGIIGIWTAGTCGWLLLLVTRIWRFHRVARRTALAPAALQHRVEHLATAFALPTLPQVRVIHAQVSPLMWRLDGRPVILLPAELLAELTHAQIDGILAHELAHLHRRDHWTRRFVLFVTALYWWHPVVWWGRRGLEQAAEQCCDAAVVDRLPDSSRDYAAALLQTIDFLSGARPRLPTSATAFGQGRNLKRRFTMILDKGVSARLSWKLRGVLAAVGLTVLAVSPWAAAEEPPDRKQNGSEPAWYSKSYQQDVAPSSQTEENLSATTQKLPDGEDKYSIQFRVAHRKGDSDEFFTTSTPRLIVGAQQDAILDTYQKRPVYFTWRTPTKGDYLLTFDVSDGWRVQLKLYGGREGWVTVDASFETNEFVAIDQKPIRVDQMHQPIRVQGQKLRVIESVRLGEKVVVPFDGGTDLKTAQQLLEFTVTRLEPGKPKSPDEAVLTYPSPADAVNAPTEAEVRTLLIERLKEKNGAPPFMETTAIKNLRISIELVADKKEDVKFYPMVGPARLHKRHYKCTAFFDVERQANWPVPFRNIMGGKEVFYIDRDNLVRATGPTGDKTSAGSPVRVLSDTGIVGEIVDDDRKNTP